MTFNKVSLLRKLSCNCIRMQLLAGINNEGTGNTGRGKPSAHAWLRSHPGSWARVCAVPHVRMGVEGKKRQWTGKVFWRNSVISYKRTKVFGVVRVNRLWRAFSEDLTRLSNKMTDEMQRRYVGSEIHGLKNLHNCSFTYKMIVSELSFPPITTGSNILGSW